MGCTVWVTFLRLKGIVHYRRKTKKLTLHLGITPNWGDILLAKYAPETMGFTRTQLNYRPFNLDLEMRVETKKLKYSFSQRGKLAMPLQEMVWGHTLAVAQINME